jgi:hypothetical protein
MVVFLNRERLESPLPYMTAGAVAPVITPHVRCEKPLHPSAQVAIRVRPQSKMKVIRHNAVSNHSHRHPLAAQSNQIKKSLIILLAIEDVLFCVAAIDNVVTDISDRSARSPWHACFLFGRSENRKKKVEWPTLVQNRFFN